MSTNLHQELTAPSEALDNDSIQPSEAPPLLQREAIELDEPVDPVREGVLPSGTAKPTTSPAHLGQRIKIFWGRQISIVVPHDDCVDHFGKAQLVFIQFFAFAVYPSFQCQASIAIYKERACREATRTLTLALLS